MSKTPEKKPGKAPPPPPSEDPQSAEINDQKHSITLPLELSLALNQAVSAEKARRMREGMKGRVTDSTIIRDLIRKHLPPAPKY